jgi:hypothetical protein
VCVCVCCLHETKTRVSKQHTDFCQYVYVSKYLIINNYEGKGTTRYLVDPASSHMLVSKIKPCMSKNKLLNGESANGSLNQL